MYEEAQIQEGRSSILEWLKERLAQEVIVVEEKQTYDIASLLSQTREVTKKRKGMKISKVIRDDSGSRKLQIATPRVEKY